MITGKNNEYIVRQLLNNILNENAINMQFYYNQLKNTDIDYNKKLIINYKDLSESFKQNNFAIYANSLCSKIAKNKLKGLKDINEKWGITEEFTIDFDNLLNDILSDIKQKNNRCFNLISPPDNKLLFQSEQSLKFFKYIVDDTKIEWLKNITFYVCNENNESYIMNYGNNAGGFINHKDFYKKTNKILDNISIILVFNTDRYDYSDNSLKSVIKHEITHALDILKNDYINMLDSDCFLENRNYLLASDFNIYDYNSKFNFNKITAEEISNIIIYIMYFTNYSEKHALMNNYVKDIENFINRKLYFQNYNTDNYIYNYIIKNASNDTLNILQMNYVVNKLLKNANIETLNEFNKKYMPTIKLIYNNKYKSIKALLKNYQRILNKQLLHLTKWAKYFIKLNNIKNYDSK